MSNAQELYEEGVDRNARHGVHRSVGRVGGKRLGRRTGSRAPIEYLELEEESLLAQGVEPECLLQGGLGRLRVGCSLCSGQGCVAVGLLR